MDPAYRKPVAGLVAGLVLSALGPVLGWLVTVASLVRSFGVVAAVDPADKAAVLSAGIARSMGATAVGLGVGSLGVLIALLSLVFLARAWATRKEREPAPSPDR